jgi:hypothetical protein
MCLISSDEFESTLENLPSNAIDLNEDGDEGAVKELEGEVKDDVTKEEEDDADDA